MTAAEMAALHARCFTVPRPYSKAELAVFLEGDDHFACQASNGFAIGRVVADEAELLTLAVDPAHRRRGAGRALLAEFERLAAERGAERAFLEVAAGNAAAIGLYLGAGYAETGRRSGYYRHSDGAREDAILMSKRLGAIDPA